MIKILSPGIKHYKITCSKCGCIFTFEEEDLHMDYDSDKNDSFFTIYCPDCKKRHTTYDRNDWAVFYGE